MPSTSRGKAPTRWTPSSEMDGPNSTMMVRSTAKLASISATNRHSRLANGEFFSSLLEHAPIGWLLHAEHADRRALRGTIARVDSHPSGLERWSKDAPCTTVARHLASHMARRRARSLRSYRPSVIVLCTIQCPQLLDG